MSQLFEDRGIDGMQYTAKSQAQTSQKRMGSGRSLSSEKMAPAVALGNSGHDRSHIGRIFGCSMGFGLKYVKRYRETGSLKYKPGRGCPRVTIV